MLLEAIFVIIAISFVFCCCTFCCYFLFHFLLTEGEDEDDQPTKSEVFEAKHYYDPLPLSTPSPPDTIFKPTPYTFKLQNGNGMYSTALPHAVINPAVLQYPPGHVLDQQRVQTRHHTPPAQQRQSKREMTQSHNHVRSRSPSPRGRRPRNVWSTETDFQQPIYYSRQNNHQNHHQERQQQRVQLPYEYEYDQYEQQQQQYSHPRHFPQQYHQKMEPFMASSHATNSHTHHHQHKYKSRLKEAVT